MTERMLDDTLTATSFAPDAADGPLPERAQVVVVGGGIAGSSIAYHLAGLGITDVLLLERARIASGTSWHAAGLVARVRGSHPMTELANYGVDLYRELADETGVDVHFRPTGSLTLAENEGRLDGAPLRGRDRPSPRDRGPSLEPSEVPEVWPLASPDGLVGALHPARRRHREPRVRGARSREGRARPWRDDPRGRLRDRASSPNERAVHRRSHRSWRRRRRRPSSSRAVCGPVTSPRPSAFRWRSTRPSTSTSRPNRSRASHDLLPLMRGLDGSFYARHHAGGLMIGAFEPDGRPRPTGSIPEDWAFGEFGPDWEHFAPVRANAERRIPALEGREVHAIPPRARVLHPRFQLLPRRDRRDPEPLRRRRLQLPGDHLLAGRGTRPRGVDPRGRAHLRRLRGRRPALRDHPRRTSATSTSGRRKRSDVCTRCTGRTSRRRPRATSGARLSTTASRPPARASASSRSGSARTGSRLRAWSPIDEYSFGRQNWFPYAAEEHRAAREAVALFDLSSFAKIEVTGRGRAPTAPARLHERRRRPCREGRLHAVPEPARRHRERRDGHAPRRGSIPRHHADRHAAPHARVAPLARPTACP